ncbi:TOMM precursor leader peptide-binding protein [Pedobacter caeni]|uniref:Bacteriocin biosynthesis cyclodehydratase domain-containing protein n=1 Tax=Pedobacter caeni TaxID=288992 RepID=A0A1M5F3U0_9SPHI|nr:TOMM precursor leader peptide-binding protein [Pedobacter caeni]SHF86038.1 bacteriocin biosynthesis cyclodehydratase domain-containing protein [Pedobacter caeni]
MIKGTHNVVSDKIELLESMSYSMLYTLEARALATLFYPEFEFSDPYSVAIKKEINVAIPIDKTDRDFIFSITERAKIFDQVTRTFLRQSPEATVLSLGCGLCSRANRLQHDTKETKWINIDLKHVIEIRNVLYAEDPNISNKVCDDIENANWLDELECDEDRPVFLIMEGVSPYLTQDKLEKLLYNIGQKLRSKTTKVKILFDYCHPDYSYDGTIINSRSVKKVDFQAGFKNASAITAVVAGSKIIGSYNTLAGNSIAYANAEADFKSQNNGETPYEITLLAFGEEDERTDFYYFDKPLFWNKRYTRQAAAGGNYLFLAETDHFICSQQEYDLVVSFLSGRNKLYSNIQEEVSAVYGVNLFLEAGVLLEEEPDEVLLLSDFSSNPKEISVGVHQLLLFTEVQETTLLVDFIKEISAGIPTLFVFTDDPLDPRLNRVEEFFLNQMKQWVLIKLSGEQMLLGPVFFASTSKTIGYNCLSIQLWRNQPVRKWGSKDPAIPMVIPVVFSIDQFLKYRTVLANLLNEMLAGRPSVMMAMDVMTAKIEAHPVSPQCKGMACDQYVPVGNKQSAFVFNSRPKINTNDGGYRTIAPEQTLKNLESVISAVTGIVHPVNCLTGDDAALNIYSTVFSKVPQKEGLLTSDDFIQYSLGKGISKEQSKVSALSEAIERYNAMYDGTEECVSGKGEQLDAKAFFPEQLKRYSQHQLERFAKDLNGRQAVKEMARDMVLHWTPAYSLLNQKKAYFPFTFCYSNTPYRDEVYMRFDSNGCAAGNTLEEAVLQGFLELIERDAVAIWWYNRISRPSVCIDGLNPDVLGKIRNALDENWNYWILDLTHDFEIPVVVAVGKNKISAEFRLGFGAHPEMAIACTRALTELYQIIVINNGHKTAFKFNKIEDQPFLYPAVAIKPKVFKDDDIAICPDIKEDIEYCMRQTAGLGFDLFVVNTTRPATPLYTVKVIIPGLVFIWPELGNSRLFELPVKLSWQTVKLVESELNQQELFL